VFSIAKVCPGDIATYKQVRGGSRRIEHWNVAQNHGRAVGRTITGISLGKNEWMQPFVKVPIFWSARTFFLALGCPRGVLMRTPEGQQLRYCGVSNQWDDVYINGNVDEMKFIAYYIKDGEVVAVARFVAVTW
jgi:apoptosis-inducing factor 3